MQRRRSSWLLAAIVLLAVLHSVTWLVVTLQMDAALENHVVLWRNQGWQLDHGAVSHSGWPLAARLEVPAVRLTEVSSGNAWQSANATLEIQALHPMRLDVTLSGPHVLARAGSQPVPITTEAFGGTFGLMQPQTGDIEVRGLVAQTPTGQLTLAALNVHLLRDLAAGPAVDAVTVQAVALDLDIASQVAVRGLGATIGRITLAAGLSGPLPHGSTPAAWRDAGGRLALHQLNVAWGKLDAQTSAIIALDGKLQPEGTGTIAAAGIPETLDVLVGAGMIPPGPARSIKAVLLFTARSPDGRLTLPLALKDRMLSIARFPLVQIPELHWP